MPLGSIIRIQTEMGERLLPSTPNAQRPTLNVQRPIGRMALLLVLVLVLMLIINLWL